MRHLTMVGLAALLAGCASSGGGLEPTGSRHPVYVESNSNFGPELPTNLVLHYDAAASSTRIPATPDAVWAVLPMVYESLEIPVAYRNPEKKQIGNLNLRVREELGGVELSNYLSCGRLSGMIAVPKADRYAVTMGVITFVEETAEGGAVLLKTRVTGFAQPQFSSGSGVRCTSQGEIEEGIAERVRALLGI